MKRKVSASVAKAVYLEVANHGGRLSLLKNRSFVRFLWNACLAPKYGGKCLRLTSEDQQGLMKVRMNRKAPAPLFIGLFDEIAGSAYIDREARRRTPTDTSLFLAEFIYYVAQTIIPDESFRYGTTQWLLGDVVVNKTGLALPRLLAACYLSNKHLCRFIGRSSTRESLARATAWYLVNGMNNQAKCNIDIADSLIRIVSQRDNASLAETWTKVLMLADGVVKTSARSSCQSKVLSRDGSCGWFAQASETSHVWLKKCKTLKLASYPTRNSVSSKPASKSVVSQSKPCERRDQVAGKKRNQVIAGGVNLVGWARTPIGIGEDVRTAAACFERAKVPFCILDAAERLPPGPRQQNLGFKTRFSTVPRYRTDVVFLDAATLYRYYLWDWARDQKVDRMVIAVSPWELPKWPTHLAFVLEAVDEFWAATEYIRKSFVAALGKRPSRLMPPAVVVPQRHRRQPGHINSSKKRFLTVFDGLSSIHRKNPGAAIQAFKLAFPKKKSVELVVKTMNLSPTSDEERLLLQQVGSDSRIKIINETMTRSGLWELMKSSDCFISLHRAEGFGRNIAEAMLIGCPVIVSNFSGNTDFCTQDNSWLVNGRMVPILPGQYSLAHKQDWFEAGVEEAASHMVDIANNAENSADRAALGQRHIAEHHSVEQVAANYRSAISDYIR